MNNEKIFEKILTNMDHYENKKDLIRFILRIDRILNNRKNVFSEIIENFEKEIANGVDNESLEKIKKITYGFLIRNEKKYTKKIKEDEYTIYEYNEYFEIYTNKILDLNIFLEKKFKDKKIKLIEIDGQKWKNINNVQKCDLEKIKKCKIIINKN